MSLLGVYLFSQGQSVTSVSPNRGMQGEPLQVTISCSEDVFSQATETYAMFSNGYSSFYLYLSQIIDGNTAVFAGNSGGGELPGYYDLYLEIYNRYDIVYSMYEPSVFYLEGNQDFPRVTSVTPNSGMQGERLEVSISVDNINLMQGTSTQYPDYNEEFDQATTTIQWGYLYRNANNNIYDDENYININELTIVDSSTISGVVYVPYSVDTGLYNIQLRGNWIEVSGAGVFTVEEGVLPEISNVSPTIVEQGATVTFTFDIDGLNLSELYYPIVALSDGDLDILSYTEDVYIVDDNTISATIDVGYFPEGEFKLLLYTDEYGIIWDDEVITVETSQISPVITNVEPSQVTTSEIHEGLVVSISGDNIDFSQGSDCLDVYFQQGTSTIFLNSIQIENNEIRGVVYPYWEGIQPGYYNLYVRNYCQYFYQVLDNALLVQNYENEPFIESVEPWYAFPGVQSTFTVNGFNTNFEVGNTYIESYSLNNTSVTVTGSDVVEMSFSLPENYWNYSDLFLVNGEQVYNLSGRIQTVWDGTDEYAYEHKTVAIAAGYGAQVDLVDVIGSYFVLPESVTLFGDNASIGTVTDGILTIAANQDNIEPVLVGYATETRDVDAIVLEINMVTPQIIESEVVEYSENGDSVIAQLPLNVVDVSSLNGDVTYSATMPDGSPLPEWIIFDAENLTFYILRNDLKSTETVNVMVVATDSDENTALAVVALSYEITVIEESADVEISVYPNPTKENVELIAPFAAEYKVINAAGNVVLIGSVLAYETVMLILPAEAGVYMLIMDSGTEIVTEQIIVE